MGLKQILAILKLVAKQITLPSWATIVLSLVAGAITAVLQAHVFTFAPPWPNDLSMAVVCIGVFVGPATGTAFRNALHLPLKVVTAITVAIAIAGIVAMTITNRDVRAIVFGVITVLGLLGFGPGTAVLMVRLHPTPAAHVPPAGGSGAEPTRFAGAKP